MIIVRGYEIAVDVAEELSPFNLERYEQNGEEIKACSPFRNESNPSFYINAETGLWKDFGSDSENLGQGNLITLLAHLRQETFEESEAYLLEKYNVFIDEVEGLELNINIQIQDDDKGVFSREDLQPYLFRYPKYLLNRGISEEIQSKFIIGYCRKDKAVAFFWRDSYTGKIVSVKFRNIYKKQFYYLRGGQSVSRHVFGLYNVIQEGYKKIFIVESEIDAMYLWTHGVPAVALGGSSLSPSQYRRILLSGVETIVVASDKDKAGEKLAKQIETSFSGHLEVMEAVFPRYATDVNDIKPEDIKKVTDSVEPITLEMGLQLKM